MPPGERNTYCFAMKATDIDPPARLDIRLRYQPSSTEYHISYYWSYTFNYTGWKLYSAYSALTIISTFPALNLVWQLSTLFQLFCSHSHSLLSFFSLHFVFVVFFKFAFRSLRKSFCFCFLFIPASTLLDHFWRGKKRAWPGIEPGTTRIREPPWEGGSESLWDIRSAYHTSRPPGLCCERAAVRTRSDLLDSNSKLDSKLDFRLKTRTWKSDSISISNSQFPRQMLD